ncbi:MAG TPA: MG2 domain-containing protein [Acidobacteriota bacterium]|nr:MG2 domain-containing protein [Acidobacteriota bacterium]
MRRPIAVLGIPFCIAAFVLGSEPATAQPRIDAEALRVHLGEPGEGLTIELQLDRSADEPAPLQLWVSLLGPSNNTLFLENVEVEPDQRLVRLDASAARPLIEVGKLHAYRLNYRLYDSNQSTVGRGWRSLHHLVPAYFDLRLTRLRPVTDWSFARPIHAQAFHPVMDHVVSGVEMTLRVHWPGGEKTWTATTDQGGLARFDVALDRELPADTRPEFYLRGSLKGIVREIEGNLGELPPSRLLTSLDKPLYQPGQSVRARVLLRAPPGAGLQGYRIRLVAEDPEGLEVHRSEHTTSRWGVVAADFNLPEETPTGIYSLEAECLEASLHCYSGDRSFRVQPYELPTFRVTVETDRAYYLKGQAPRLAVAAEYLSGRPLESGVVEIRRPARRRYDPKTRQWKTEEPELEYQASLGKQGSAEILLDVEDDFAELRSDGYYYDVEFIATVRDLQGGRQVQQPVYLRLSRDPVHPRVISAVEADGHFFVSTSTADGEPISCRVSFETDEGLQLTRVETNRFGLGKGHLGPDPDDRDDVALKADCAGDLQGGVDGQYLYEVWDSVEDLSIESGRRLYFRGQPLVATVRTNPAPGPLLVDILSKERVLRSLEVERRQPSFEVSIPYQDDFNGVVEMRVFDPLQGEQAWEKVWYKPGRAFDLRIEPDQEAFRPGDGAGVTLQLKDAAGQGRQAALALSIVDEAVHLRAQSEGLSGHGFWGAQSDPVLVHLAGPIEALAPTDEIPPDLELALEALLKSEGFGGLPRDGDASPPHADYGEIFADLLKKQLQPLRAALKADPPLLEAPRPQPLGPADFLALSQVEAASLLDPWHQPFSITCSSHARESTMHVASAGPDGLPGTSDDFGVMAHTWKYLGPQMERVEESVNRYMEEHLRPVDSLRMLERLLAREGLHINRWRSPCGLPIYYLLEGEEEKLFLYAIAKEYGGKIERYDRWRALAVASWDYFRPYALRLDALAEQYRQEHGEPFEDEMAFRRALEQAGLEESRLRDYHDRQLVIETQFVTGVMQVRLLSLGSDGERNRLGGAGDDFVVWSTPVGDFSAGWRPRILAALKDDQRVRGTIPAGTSQVLRVLQSAGIDPDSIRDPWGRLLEVDWKIEPLSSRFLSQNPVSQQGLGFVSIRLFSPGSDGKAGSVDDIVPVLISARVELPSEVPLDEIADRVDRLEGAYLPDQALLRGTVRDQTGSVIPAATVTATGKNGITAVARTSDTGQYTLWLPGGLYDVKVALPGFRPARFPEVTLTEAGGTDLDVTLEVGEVDECLMLCSCEIACNGRNAVEVVRVAAEAQPEVMTPKVRRYFPETLYWDPELITDEQGRARVEFPLADSITTWRVSALASTLMGDLVSTVGGFRTFQPFFAELDPPALLTQGDRIELPALLRNYRDQRADLEVRLDTSASLAVDHPRHNLSVDAQQSESLPFGVTASHVSHEAVLKLSALSGEVADAVEKTLEVRPLGRRMEATESLLARDSGTLSVDLPEDLMEGSAEGWLVVYPGILEHLLDSREALLRQPWGCAEQVVSVSWINLMILRRLEDRSAQPHLRQRAQVFVEDGARRLLRLQGDEGGFRYFHRSAEADVSLTASILRFLAEASRWTTVPDEKLTKGIGWMVEERDSLREERVSALVAREWAALTASRPDHESARALRRPVEMAVGRLQKRLDEEQAPDPYVTAHLMLALHSLDSNDSRLPVLARKLLASAEVENGMMWWNLYGVSPFYGWGRTGSLELSAVAVQALQAAGQEFSAEAQQGRLFLLRNKDYLGSWWSTKSTLEALRALGAEGLPQSGGGAGPQPSADSLRVKVNGISLPPVRWPSPEEVSGPLRIDLSSHLTAGANQVKVDLPSAVRHELLLRVAASGYQPWAPDAEQIWQSNESLRFEVAYQDTGLLLGGQTEARVRVSRLDRGKALRRGMLLAEIGLPPGSEVDRQWLEDQGLYRYEVHPDRVVCYLWPRGDEERSFSIRFRPRLRMQARSAASRLYDYYNPQAAVTLAPTAFTVR